MGEKAGAIGLEPGPAIADFLDPIRIEQGWRRRAIRQRKRFAGRPLAAQLSLQPVIGDVEAFPGSIDAIGVARAFGPKRVTDDRLHVAHDVKVEETIEKSNPPPELVLWDPAVRAGMSVLQMFDDRS